MSVEVLDGATIRDFVEDESSFNGSIEGRFAALDANHDGLLSYAEMARELESLREMMLAVASGLGFLPVQMVLEEGSFLKMAVERESVKIAA
ncbi:unnamed protein product [Spirodela intermedia]|uniref:Uncharacterized protein n=1 Tax=Spirodela intermedia TaxID=51605 RepID=A0A7I8JL01_SPIIN|nr:unnamed protein product [Spirodela intermedia]CAA6670829.1 unnamed protein product [Spirodela intermedia]